jgi:hypothetical protein
MRVVLRVWQALRRPRMTSWRDLIGERDREILEAAGYGQAVGFGETPALLVVNHRGQGVGQLRRIHV